MWRYGLVYHGKPMPWCWIRFAQEDNEEEQEQQRLLHANFRFFFFFLNDRKRIVTKADYFYELGGKFLRPK